MKTIKSFHNDYEKLGPGIYVSRKDDFGRGLFSGTITTFDLRFTRPNDELPMSQAAMYTIERLGDIYLRDFSDLEDEIVYFGPMGCREGFHLLIWGNYNIEDSEITKLVEDMCKYILYYSGEISGAEPVEHGHYLEYDLMLARMYAGRLLNTLILG